MTIHFGTDGWRAVISEEFTFDNVRKVAQAIAEKTLADCAAHGATNGAAPHPYPSLVVGFDTLERLFAPRYYEDMERELAPFFERHRVLAANRATVGARDVEAWLDANAGAFRERIAVLEIDEVPASLSSTQVREALQGNRQAFDVAPGVRRYIEEHGLYR